MREIKFRAWDKWGTKMYHSANETLGSFFRVVELTPQQFELMQYTGLKDKNGKEIYEGDIVRWFGKEIRYVEWDDIFAGWIITDKIGSTSLNAGGAENLEVIGNIYENKELLE